MHNKPDSFSGRLTPYEDWKPIQFKHTKKVLIEARVVCANNYYGKHYFSAFSSFLFLNFWIILEF